MTPEGDQITAAAIARLAGVGRAAVSNWRKRYPEFPQAVGGSPSSPAFDRAEVMQWLMDTGKADQLATAGRTDGGTLRVSASEAGWMRSGRAAALDTPQRTPERSIADLGPRDLLARTMAALLPRSIVPDMDADEPVLLVDEVLNPFLAAEESWLGGVSGGADLSVVVDPACGEGLALMALASRFGNRVRLAGQEVDEGVARVAAFNLAESSNGAAYEVHAGDSFTSSQLDAFLGRAAAVVCEPPFDRPDWPVKELTTDRRWEFGIPAPRDSELAWVQHCYAHLRPHGVAVAAVSQRTCVQSSGEHIRAALVRSGVLQTVIALPSGIGSLPGTDICLWVLRRPSGKPDRTPIRVVDLSGLGDPADVPLEYAAWQQLLDSDDPGVVRTVEPLDLLAEGACLLPSRYLALRGEASVDDLARTTKRLAGIYSNVGKRLPQLSAPKTASAKRRAYVTLAELERAGALTIRGRDDPPRQGDVLLRSQGRMPVVATVIKEQKDDEDELAQLAEVAGIAQVIEIDESRLDPHYVALFLRGEVARLPIANTLGAINRDDLRRCRIPRMPLAEQRRYGGTFWRLTELEAALAALSDLSAKVIEQTIYSLTSGVIAPEYEPRDEMTIKGRDQ